MPPKDPPSGTKNLFTSNRSAAVSILQQDLLLRRNVGYQPTRNPDGEEGGSKEKAWVKETKYPHIRSQWTRELLEYRDTMEQQKLARQEREDNQKRLEAEGRVRMRKQAELLKVPTVRAASSLAQTHNPASSWNATDGCEGHPSSFGASVGHSDKSHHSQGVGRATGAASAPLRGSHSPHNDPNATGDNSNSTLEISLASRGLNKVTRAAFPAEAERYATVLKVANEMHKQKHLDDLRERRQQRAQELLEEEEKRTAERERLVLEERKRQEKIRKEKQEKAEKTRQNVLHTYEAKIEAKLKRSRKDHHVQLVKREEASKRHNPKEEALREAREKADRLRAHAEQARESMYAEKEADEARKRRLQEGERERVEDWEKERDAARLEKRVERSQKDAEAARERDAKTQSLLKERLAKAKAAEIARAEAAEAAEQMHTERAKRVAKDHEARATAQAANFRREQVRRNRSNQARKQAEQQRERKFRLRKVEIEEETARAEVERVEKARRQQEQVAWNREVMEGELERRMQEQMQAATAERAKQIEQRREVLQQDHEEHAIRLEEIRERELAQRVRLANTIEAKDQKAESYVREKRDERQKEVTDALKKWEAKAEKCAEHKHRETAKFAGKMRRREKEWEAQLSRLGEQRARHKAALQERGEEETLGALSRLSMAEAKQDADQLRKAEELRKRYAESDARREGMLRLKQEASEALAMAHREPHRVAKRVGSSMGGIPHVPIEERRRLKAEEALAAREANLAELEKRREEEGRKRREQNQAKEARQREIDDSVGRRRRKLVRERAKRANEMAARREEEAEEKRRLLHKRRVVADEVRRQHMEVARLLEEEMVERTEASILAKHGEKGCSDRWMAVAEQEMLRSHQLQHSE